jgi:hypothetical protein
MKEGIMKSFKQNQMTWGARLGAVAVIGIFLAWTSVATAGITWWSCDGDGGVTFVGTPGWNYDAGSGTYNLSVTADQTGPGGTVMNLTTNSEQDPAIGGSWYVTNDTATSWIGYLLTVTIDVPTPLTSSSITNLSVANPELDWTATITQPITFTGIVGGQYQYAGNIDLAGGTPVGNGDELDFGYKITLAGATSYLVTQTQMPITAVPEPSTLILALGGLLGLAVVRIARRRRA